MNNFLKIYLFYCRVEWKGSDCREEWKGSDILSCSLGCLSAILEIKFKQTELISNLVHNTVISYEFD